MKSWVVLSRCLTLMAAFPLACSTPTQTPTDGAPDGGKARYDARPPDVPLPTTCGVAAGSKPQPLWSRRLGHRSLIEPSALARFADGTVCQAGTFYGEAEFGTLRLSGNDWHSYVACFRADGTALWAKKFGPKVQSSPLELLAAGEDRLVVAGSFIGSIDVGGGPLTSQSSSSAFFLASFDKQGQHRWSTVVEGIGARGLTTDRAGNLLLAGSSDGLTLGALPLGTIAGDTTFVIGLDAEGAYRFHHVFAGLTTIITSVAVNETGAMAIAAFSLVPITLGAGLEVKDTYVARLDSQGQVLWAKTFPSYVHATVDDHGDVTVAGGFSEPIDLGGGTLSSAGASDIFLVSYAPDGQHRWSRHFGGTGRDALFLAGDLRVDAAGNLSLLATISGPVDFGGGPLAGLDDSLVAANFDRSGAHRWSRLLGHDFRDAAMHVNAGGEVTIRGFFSGQWDFGGGALTSKGYQHDFVATYAPTGQHLSSFTTTRWLAGGSSIHEVVLDTAGNLALAGRFQTELELGGQSYTTTAVRDIFLASYDVSGSLRWAKQFAGHFPHYHLALAYDGADNIVFAGKFDRSADLGGGVLTASGTEPNLFIAGFDGAGGHRWSKRFGGQGMLTVEDLAASKDGAFAVIGSFDKTLDLGGGPLVAPGAWALFVATFEGDGTHRWSKMIHAHGGDVALDADGHVTVLSSFVDKAEVADGHEVHARDATGILLASYDQHGSYRWARALDDWGIVGHAKMKADGAGNLYVVGNGAERSQSTGRRVQQLTLLSVDAAGKRRFSSHPCAPGEQLVTAVAVDERGGTVVSGYFSGTLTCGSQTLVAPTYGREDFLLALDASGCLRWIEQLGPAAQYEASSTLALTDSRLYFGATLQGPIALEGGTTSFDGGSLLALQRVTSP